MFTKTYASAVHGVEAQTITVEVNAGGNVAAGKQMYFLVGLPDNAVKEGWQRIEAAMTPPAPKPTANPVAHVDPLKPAPKKIIKPVARQQLFPAKILTSDEEIDAYVENIRKQMKQYLQGSDGIKIN